MFIFKGNTSIWSHENDEMRLGLFTKSFIDLFCRVVDCMVLLVEHPPELLILFILRISSLLCSLLYMYQICWQFAIRVPRATAPTITIMKYKPNDWTILKEIKILDEIISLPYFWADDPIKIWITAVGASKKNGDSAVLSAETAWHSRVTHTVQREWSFDSSKNLVGLVTLVYQ